MSNSCSIENDVSLTNIKYDTINTGVQYALVRLSYSGSSFRMWTFNIQLEPTYNSSSFSVALKLNEGKNCNLFNSKFLNTVQFQGNFTGFINADLNTSFPLSGINSPYVKYEWNPKTLTFTIIFTLGQYFRQVGFFATLKDTCEPWDTCFWQNIIDESCTTFASAFNNVSSTLACSEALAECETLCIGAGLGPEDPFADVLCSATCGSLEVACEATVSAGQEVSAQQLCNDAGL